MGIIADEDTVCGFMLAGIGEINDKGEPNYAAVDEHTPDLEVAAQYRRLLLRKDIAILLIDHEAADRIRQTMVELAAIKDPYVVVIPDHYGPYDINIDNILDISKHREAEENEHVQDLKKTAIENRRTTEADQPSGHSENRVHIVEQ
ncbi:unnamed protein product [Callosobruchus maculatus]|nr:unnamed protein product [Callosobruchus maculatus]